MLLSFWLLIICGAGATIIPKPEESQYCAIACSAIVGRIKFEKRPAENPVCSGPLAVQSLFDCVNQYCEIDDTKQGLDYLNWTCAREGHSFLSPYRLSSSGNLSTITAQEAKANRFTLPVVPNEEYYQFALGSTITRYAATQASWDFVFGLYGYWGLVMLVCILQRINRLRHTPYCPNQRLSAQRLLNILPLGSSPSRQAVTVIIAVYAMLCVIACFPAYDTFPGNIFYASKRIELGKYISNRLGTLTIANIPVIWLFAARNNPLLWVCGWPYSVFSQLHRWIARLTALLAIAHGIGYSITNSYKKTYYITWNETYWRWGVVALLSICVLVATSISILRARCYDFFLPIHVLFAAIALGSVYYHHNELLERDTYHSFIWIAVAIWIAERLLQFIRIVRIGHAQIDASAKLTLPEGSDLLRLDVTEYFKNGRHAPVIGQYYFIREPVRWKGWESHPFTLCSWPLESSTLDGPQEVTKGAATEINAGIGHDSEIGHSFLIRPRTGFTRRLKDLALSPASSSMMPSREVGDSERKIRLLLEGPYPIATSAFSPSSSNLLIVAGGSGISSCISRLYQYIAHEDYLRVHLVWAVRSIGTFNDLAKHELACLTTNGKKKQRVEISVYLTSSSASCHAQGRNSKQEGSEADYQAQDAQLPYKTFPGRPNFDALISNERHRASVHSSYLSIFCCGPPSLEMRCRDATRFSVRTGQGPPIEFLAQEHGW